MAIPPEPPSPPSAPTPPARPTLIYDGDCGFCRRWSERWRRASGGKLEIMPSGKAIAWMPGLSPAALAEAVHLVEPDGRTSRGAEASFRALALAPMWRWLLWLYVGLPGFALVAEAIYRQVAVHRYRLSRLELFLHGPGQGPPAYFLARWTFLRGMGIIYLLAFLSLLPQIGGLVGPRGILPAEELLAAAHTQLGADAYGLLPTLAWLHPGGATPQILCAAGAVLSLMMVAGLAPLLVTPLLWLLYLSVVTIGQDFLSFQWDALLLETGLLAIFLAPRGWRPGLGLASPPRPAAIFLLRWHLFRFMFSSGMVKLVSGDTTWWDLTSLTHHYQTQPLPTPLAWYAHHLPLGLHQASLLITMIIEIALPFLIFMPRRVRLVPAAAFTLLMVIIAATGNYGFFNLLTVVMVLPLLDDTLLRRCLPRLSWKLSTARAPRHSWRGRAASLAAAFLAALGLAAMLSRLAPAAVPEAARAALRAVSPLRSVNSYGLFAVMTVTRPEIIVEGSQDGASWTAYEFRWKPGNLAAAPALVAPHMPRLDWQMWFAALGSARQTRWFGPFLGRLLQGEAEVVGLLAGNPFPAQPPRYVRARLLDYRFSEPGSPDWWQARELGLYAGPVELRAP